MARLPLWVYVGIGGLLLAAVCAFVAYNAGAESVQREWDASVERGKAEVERLKAEANKITTVTEVKVEYRDRVIYEKGEDIIKTVEVFVPSTAKCELDGGFRVFHDASANNAVPDAAEIADAGAVPPQTLARTIADNYTGCHRNASKLEQWQQWAIDQCEASPECDADELRALATHLNRVPRL